MEENEIFGSESDVQVTLDDVEEVSSEPTELKSLSGHVIDRYQKAEDARRQDEERWLQSYRNYRGLYGPDVQFTEAEKSRVFIKVTKTKTLAAYGQIIDVLFANQKFPISVEPTVLPEGVAESVHFDMQQKPESSAPESEDSLFGFAGDGKDFPPGATADSLREMLGPLKNKLADVEGLTEGPGLTGTQVSFEPALVAAKKNGKENNGSVRGSSCF